MGLHLKLVDRLTELGKQFVHYAMTDLPLKIEYKE
jgi:hypothetical protein